MHALMFRGRIIKEGSPQDLMAFRNLFTKETRKNLVLVEDKPTRNTWRVLSSTRLKAESPRQAFYDLALIRISEGFLVRKESGCNGKVTHRETWFRETLEEASRLYQAIIQEKTDPSRRSPRKYRVEVFSNA